MNKTDTVKTILRENNILLAPMAGVTDRAFRAICKEQGCGLTFTEMVSAKGLHYGYGSEGNKSADLLTMAPEEKPACVQIFGRDPQIMAEQAKRICDECGDDLAWIDINMGCPAPKITKNGEGSALMKEPLHAAEIIRTVNKAIEKPVTVKFRLGWHEYSINAFEFAKMAESEGAAAVTIHGRTREQFYSGKADWTEIIRIKEALEIPVIGNGDIFTAQDAKRRLDESAVDALMVARGAQGNPWLFAEIRALLDHGETLNAPSAKARLDMALRHAKQLQEFRGEHAVVEMRKHVAWYITGLKGAAKARNEINRCSNLEEMKIVFDRLLEEQCA